MEEAKSELEAGAAYTLPQQAVAWLVHIFTASGAIFGLWALWNIHLENFKLAFWLMGVTVFIDSVDGILARRANTKQIAYQIDGGLLDNIVDYFTYVIVPAFFLLGFELLPQGGWVIMATSVMMLASAYQFTQTDAKTTDHFFKGFPSYWNIVVFYLFFWQLSPWINLAIILLLGMLVFVPIKYVYPSRLDYLSRRRAVRGAMFFASVLWALATAGMLIVYPDNNSLFVVVSMGYVILYFLVSLYRTFNPIGPILIET